jgi:hypothetical protein
MTPSTHLPLSLHAPVDGLFHAPSAAPPHIAATAVNPITVHTPIQFLLMVTPVISQLLGEPADTKITVWYSKRKAAHWQWYFRKGMTCRLLKNWVCFI